MAYLLFNYNNKFKCKKWNVIESMTTDSKKTANKSFNTTSSTAC